MVSGTVGPRDGGGGRRLLIPALAALLIGAAPLPAGFTLVPGGFEAGRQPDGNSVVIYAPAGMIVVDTGRHKAHTDKVLAAARAAGKPVAAVINTHWHLDHVSGNPAVKAAFPAARIYASVAIDEALTGFLARSAADARAALASGKLDAAMAEEVRGDLATIEAGERLKPDVRVTRSGRTRIAGRLLDLRLASHAATAGDVWVYDPATRVAIVGDLVTLPAPFLDTACPEGWRKALAEVSATRFRTLVPGHGPVLDRAAFDAYRQGFEALIDCAASDAKAEACATAWGQAAHAVDPANDEVRAVRMAAYYVTEVLRRPGGTACPA